MDDLLKKLVGQAVVGVTQAETLSLELDSGARVHIYNKVTWLGCADPSRLKGRTLDRVTRRIDRVVVDFGGLQFEFVDEYPDTAAPEVAAVHFPDGRIFVHQGEETAR